MDKPLDERHKVRADRRLGFRLVVSSASTDRKPGAIQSAYFIEAHQGTGMRWFADRKKAFIRD
ncbi:hypothetical protein [Pseudomonas sp. NFIX28]|uniref:hypothetical protein n=1 Tax=Pseudomonas sp. NFIX28 TaxID=1566235 RepID=UPI001113D731|nr:hypothetical protein [Pseudomonas sp. NFIX28]